VSHGDSVRTRHDHIPSTRAPVRLHSRCCGSSHRNAPLSAEGRRRLVRCKHRPIAHVATEMGISRQCASKWVNRYRRFGELGLVDRSSAPCHQPTATPAEVVARIERMRRERKWAAHRIAFKLDTEGSPISRRTVTRHLHHLGLNRRRFIDPTGAVNRTQRRIVAHRPRHTVNVDIKKAGRIPDGCGWRGYGLAAAKPPKPSSAAKLPVPRRDTFTFTRRSTRSPAWPTPRPSPTRKPTPRSVSCTVSERSSPPSPTSRPNTTSVLRLKFV
jgi:transposase